MNTSLTTLNKKRKSDYYKDIVEEDFIYEMNKLLQEREFASYSDHDIKYPFIFVFGLPRSGTTIIAQLIANTFDIGYINNLVARFWLAPLHGIRISKNLLGDHKNTNFRSDYARTANITDIHEFGYFWRYWLKKENITDFVDAKEREKEIDWIGMKTSLANIQQEFNKPMVFKNLFGAYHLNRLSSTLGKVLYVYIKRDPLDVVISILDARKKHYDDINTWWSSIPVEYNQLKDLDHWEQIAGQVYYLRKFYKNEIDQSPYHNVVEVSYKDLCSNPQKVTKKIQEHCWEKYQCELNLINSPPHQFNLRTYDDRSEEKAKFKLLLEKISKQDDS